MESLVLDLVTSYENRISTVEELFTTAYQATVASNGSLAELDKARGKLKIRLRETLVKNCSLRRKDFNDLMEKVFSDSERKRREIEEEEQLVREKLKEHLNEQKELATSLREQLVEFMGEKVDKDSLEAVIANLKATCQDKGQQVFVLLRNFQLHLEVLRKEQEEINCKLQRLADRGESLRMEDLRQLEASKARQDRKAERELRREDIERLLAHFKRQRQTDSVIGDK